MCSDVTGIVQCVLAFAACVLACFIPKRIMWGQRYSSLLDKYISYDFAIAVQGIIEFFTLECNSDIDKIKSQYEQRFVKEIYDIELCEEEKIDDFATVKEMYWAKRNLNQTAPELCLHYQRRLLAQYFYQLDLCAHSWFIGKRQIQKDYTKGEANLVRLLFLMNKAIDESEILKKKLDCDYHVPASRNTKGMNKHLSHLYTVLKDCPAQMEG